MTINPELENKLRQGFKYLNRFMLLMWRLGLGKWLNMWPAGLGRYLCNASAHGACAYDAHDGKLIFHGGIMALAFSDTCVQK